MKRLTTEEFIEKAKKVHGDRYNYSKVEYKNNCIKVIIVCKIHDGFKQKPNGHLNGKGCPKCVGQNKTTKELIKQFNKIHRNKYDYSKVEYINSRTKVIIICKKHGEFSQTPNNHLRKRGMLWL